MFGKNVAYHGIIRKTIIAFGRLFSDIHIERREGDSVNGPIIQQLQIPISYAPKEKWIVRLDQDPSLENHTYTSLPRMSFEITSYGYDASRKMNKMNKIVCNDGTSSSSMFTPVPYIIDVSLYILTKTQEDGMQILEQILPVFGPEYTLAVRAVPQLNIVQDVPVTLTSVSIDDQYDGDFETRRFITHTLTFQLKINLFGDVRQNKPIYETQVGISTVDGQPPTAIHRSVGDPETYTVIEDDWIEGL